MLDGLYKAEYGVNDAFGRSVMCMHAGKMLGGNSAFAHLGTFREESNGEIAAKVITARHNDDPHYKPLMGADVAAIEAAGLDGRPQDSFGGQRRTGARQPCSGPI